MTTKLIELSEAFAAAKRKAKVAESLTTELRRKLTLSEDEENAANRELDKAAYAFEQEALVIHEETHGQFINDDDRAAFQERWDLEVARVRQIRAERDARWRADILKRDAVKDGPPDHPDHIHEDCCK